MLLIKPDNLFVNSSKRVIVQAGVYIAGEVTTRCLQEPLANDTCHRFILNPTHSIVQESSSEFSSELSSRLGAQYCIFKPLYDARSLSKIGFQSLEPSLVIVRSSSFSNNELYRVLAINISNVFKTSSCELNVRP